MKRTKVSMIAILLVFMFGIFSFGQGLLEKISSEKKVLPEETSAEWWSTVQQEIQKEEYHLSPSGDKSGALYEAPNRRRDSGPVSLGTESACRRGIRKRRSGNGGLSLFKRLKAQG